ncbi:MAG: hypothetical protein ACXQTC_04230 [Methanopyraceae archaeon]
MRREVEGAALLALGAAVLTISSYALNGFSEPPRLPETDNPALCDRFFAIVSGFLSGTVMAGMGALKFRKNEKVRAALGLLRKAEKYLEEGSERIPAKYNALTYALRALRCVKRAADLLEEVEREAEGKSESDRGGEDVRASERESGARGSGGGDGDRGERGSADDRRREEDREVPPDGDDGGEGRARGADRGDTEAG